MTQYSLVATEVLRLWYSSAEDRETDKEVNIQDFSFNDSLAANSNGFHTAQK